MSDSNTTLRHEIDCYLKKLQDDFNKKVNHLHQLAHDTRISQPALHQHLQYLCHQMEGIQHYLEWLLLEEVGGSGGHRENLALDERLMDEATKRRRYPYLYTNLTHPLHYAPR